MTPDNLQNKGSYVSWLVLPGEIYDDLTSERSNVTPQIAKDRRKWRRIADGLLARSRYPQQWETHEKEKANHRLKVFRGLPNTDPKMPQSPDNYSRDHNHFQWFSRNGGIKPSYARFITFVYRVWYDMAWNCVYQLRLTEYRLYIKMPAKTGLWTYLFICTLIWDVFVDKIDHSV